MKLRRFIPMYGGKRSIASRYPAPQHGLIVEPFAGGAGYSLEYPEHEVHLYDLDERVILVWKFLIDAEPEDVLAIPTDIKHVDEIPNWMHPGVRYLVGWWMQPAAANGPATRISTWGKQHESRSDVWGEKCRARLASQVPYIKHWHVEQMDYREMDPWYPATWFVDPPYRQKGVAYRHGARGIDYEHLAAWCRELKGQVIVCEQAGADWLPFAPLCELFGGVFKQRAQSNRLEVMSTWDTNGSDR